MRRGSHIIRICALLLAPSCVSGDAARAEEAPQSNYGPEIQNQANEILNQSLAPKECYKLDPHYFNDDLVGVALDKLFKQAPGPNGLCYQYLHHKAEFPIKLDNDRIPLGHGVYVDIIALCKLVEHPRCRE